MGALHMLRHSDPRALVRNARRHAGVVRDATAVLNPKVLRSLLGPAVRGFIFQNGKRGDGTVIPTEYSAYFTHDYEADKPALRRLYAQAKKDQWDGAIDLDWTVAVDPENPITPILRRELLPLQEIPGFDRLPAREQQRQVAHLTAWLLSQFLHGEQGALFAACQVTEAIQWMDGKLYGSTQVVDEGRHVEVFQRYLQEKLEKLYEINDNLYVIIDALMTDGRWDMKFLGMQIMIEGLALAAFGTLRQNSEEPLLRQLLARVITDEARHVHFGVIALEDYYRKALSPDELREREDWAFEVTLLMRNRFLAHEFYDEYYGHRMSRRRWDKAILASPFMKMFQQSMYRRIIPNLRRIGLLSERIQPHYAQLGLLDFAKGKAAPELSAEDMMEG